MIDHAKVSSNVDVLKIFAGDDFEDDEDLIGPGGSGSQRARRSANWGALSDRLDCAVAALTSRLCAALVLLFIIVGGLFVGKIVGAHNKVRGGFGAGQTKDIMQNTKIQNGTSDAATGRPAEISGSGGGGVAVAAECVPPNEAVDYYTTSSCCACSWRAEADKKTEKECACCQNKGVQCTSEKFKGQCVRPKHQEDCTYD